METKLIFLLLGVITILIGEAVYIRAIFKGKARPHPFTWLGWSLATGIVAAAQFSGGAGLAFLVLAVEAAVTFFIFLLALRYGERKIFLIDYISFGLGLVAIALWYVTDTPLWSVFLITIADVLMFLPTIRKTFVSPFEEELFEYYTSSLAYFFSFFALANVSLVTFFYPGVLIILNTIFIIFTLAIRKTFKYQKHLDAREANFEELYKLSMQSSEASEKMIYIFEKYSLSELLGENKAQEVRKTLIKNGITVEQISNSPDIKSAHPTNKDLDSEFIEKVMNYHYIPQDVLDITQETLIFDDTVATYTTGKDGKITIINDKAFAEQQKQLFNSIKNTGSTSL